MPSSLLRACGAPWFGWRQGSRSSSWNRYRSARLKTCSECIMTDKPLSIPERHGESAVQPSLGAWPDLLEENRRHSDEWEFRVAGVPFADFREQVRLQMLSLAVAFTERIGVETVVADVSAPFVLTGHQPDICHPGVWVKNFALAGLAGRCDAVGINVIVDTDSFTTVGVKTPSFSPDLEVSVHTLARATPEGFFAYHPPPSPADVRTFCEGGATSLETLPHSSAAENFRRYCGLLESALPETATLGESLTFARRRYESQARTAYLEIPLSTLCMTDSFRMFVAHIVTDAEYFLDVHNVELRRHREAMGIRSEAQPFPDLAVTPDGWMELPFWCQTESARRSLRCKHEGEVVLLDLGGPDPVRTPRDSSAVFDALLAADKVIAPKALTLTMFLRLFASDFFIHGAGGSRYDRVTDAVIVRYLGVEPPVFAAISLTMHLPIGEHSDPDEEIARVRHMLHRLEHNPDAMLGVLSKEDCSCYEEVAVLAEEKARLVSAISAPGADKKELGRAIRGLNSEMAALFAPYRERLEAELVHLRALKDAGAILKDRTYPFCFWSPDEIAAKVM